MNTGNSRDPRGAGSRGCRPGGIAGSPRVLGAAALLALLVWAVYHPVSGFDFVNYDDYGFVADNPAVAGGLSWAGVRWAFTTNHGSNWIPLAWLSHMADVALFGMDPGSHHLTSVLFHAANAVLLFLVFHRLTGAAARSLAVAALYAVHPLNVESVAWIAERKNVLSAFFGLSSLLAYAHYATRRRWKLYVLSLVAYLLSLLSKSLFVTLPFLLVLLDVWPLGRISEARRRAVASPGVGGLLRGWSAQSPVLLEKLPFFLLTFAGTSVHFLAAAGGGASRNFELAPLPARIGNALVSYVSYVAKAVWPAKLAVVYPHPGGALPAWQVALAAAALAGTTVLALRAARRQPCLAVGWLWFLGSLVPMSGLVQVGPHAMADRFAYLPLVGLLAALVWGLGDLFAALRIGKPAVTAAAAAVTAAMSLAAATQVGFWRDGILLSRHALAVTRGNWFVHFSLGGTHARRGQFDEAIAEFRETLRLRPDYYPALNALGMVHLLRDRPAEAAVEFGRALALEPGYQEAALNFGSALVRLGRHQEAIAACERALRRAGPNADLYALKGEVELRIGRREDAVRSFRQALGADPGHEAAARYLAVLQPRSPAIGSAGGGRHPGAARK